MRSLLFAACVAISAPAGAQAPDGAAAQAPDRARMTERHEKMAALHKKAAECLQAGKPVEECHDAMMKDAPMGRPGDCPFMGEKCPMRGHGGMRGGRGRGMRGAPAEEKTTP